LELWNLQRSNSVTGVRMIMFIFDCFDVLKESEAVEILNDIENLLEFLVPLTVMIIVIIMAYQFYCLCVVILEILLKQDKRQSDLPPYLVPQESISIVSTIDESREMKQNKRRLYEAVCSDGCNCVSITVFAEPWSVYKCHCQDCRDSNFRKPVTWMAFSQKDVQVSAIGAALSQEKMRTMCSRCLTKMYMIYKRDSDIYINRDLFKNIPFRDAHIEKLRLSIPKFEAAHIWLGTETPSGAKFLDTEDGKVYAEEYIKPLHWIKYDKFSF